MAVAAQARRVAAGNTWQCRRHGFLARVPQAGKTAGNDGPRRPVGERNATAKGYYVGVKMDYPTFRGKRTPPAKLPVRRNKSTIVESRVNPPPKIYVQVEGRAYWETSYARAHLRNRRGYVYLAWRDGERVRELYLWKAPRKSPTVERGGPGARPAAAELVAGAARRGKTKA